MTSDAPDYLRRQVIAALRTEAYHLTGREYRVQYTRLDLTDLQELLRMVKDCAHEKRAAANQARMQPWRRG